jgi:hypothetical protein
LTDRATAAGKRLGKHRLAEDSDRQERSAQVERDNVVERSHRQVEERAVRDGRSGHVPTRRVHEHVDMTMVEHGSSRGLELLDIEDVALQCKCVGAASSQLVGERFAPFHRARQYNDGRADFGELAAYSCLRTWRLLQRLIDASGRLLRVRGKAPHP